MLYVYGIQQEYVLHLESDRRCLHERILFRLLLLYVTMIPEKEKKRMICEK